MRFSFICFISLFYLFPGAVAAGDQALTPLMAVPDEVAFESDFSRVIPLKKPGWIQRQGTRWEIADGVLRGQPSTAEYQAKKTNHRGLEPRLSLPMTPAEFITAFSLRFLEGDENKIIPFIEFGHHVCRIKFNRNGKVQLLVEHETMLIAEADKFPFESGKWIHVLAEMKGDEFVIQFAGGPTLYGKHPSFSEAVKKGDTNIGITGTRNGKVEIDDMTIWTVKDGGEQRGWTGKRDKFPHFKVIQVKERKQKK